MTLRRALAAFLLLSLGTWVLWRVHSAYSSASLRDSFTSRGLAGWQIYGGSWEGLDGTVRNNSDERGAKIVTGDPRWRNTRLDVDLQVLGAAGDVGAMIRVQQPEFGVDAYDGYYAGLRTTDNALVLGRADHGWSEFQVVAFPGGLRILHPYHLSLLAQECTVLAIASDPATGETVRAALSEAACPRTGKIGLRSYSSGGVWKNVRVTAVDPAVFARLLSGITPAASPSTLQTEAGFNAALATHDSSAATGKQPRPATALLDVPVSSIGSLPLSARPLASLARVHGVVTLSNGEVYLQDSTGGARILHPTLAQIHIGDELEIAGHPTVTPFGTQFSSPEISVLRSREPTPPLAILPSQAVSGDFVDRFVELEGRLTQSAFERDGVTVLTLESGAQRFEATLEPRGENSTDLMRLARNSRVRLRGVLIVSAAATDRFIPFVLLLRSAEDVTLLEGPPWWSLAHLIELSWVVVALALAGTLVYLQLERWRLNAITEERSRLAREIHDTLAQSFAAISFQLESSLDGMDAGQPQFTPVQTALQMSRQSRKDAHVTISTLRSMHSGDNLEGMLENILKPLFAGRQAVLRITAAASNCGLEADMAHQILRIVQEAASNAVRHAHCSTVSVFFKQERSTLLLTITDDGNGFQLPESLEYERHFGLLGMQERARSLRGTLQIVSSHQGTTVTLECPLPERRHWMGFKALHQQMRGGFGSRHTRGTARVRS